MTTQAHNQWQWWVGDNNETFQTSFATRDEAVKAAMSQGGGYICEALPPEALRLSHFVDVDKMVEVAEELAMDEQASPDSDCPLIFDLDENAHEDLVGCIKIAIDVWQGMSGLHFAGTKFASIRNEAYVPPVDALGADE